MLGRLVLRGKLAFACALLFLAGAAPSQAESGREAWLRYARLDPRAAEKIGKELPPAVFTLGNSAILKSSQQELSEGVQSLLGKSLRIQSQLDGSAVVLGTFSSLHSAIPSFSPTAAALPDDSFLIRALREKNRALLVIAAPNERGVLYGVFALLRKIAQGESLLNIEKVEQPYAPLRWIDQWDNLDGSIERGYAGRSIFFENGHLRSDLTRVQEYARLLASVGINGCAINNVNADPRLLRADYLPELVRIADAFRPWGIQLSIAVDVGSPKSVGGLATFDPLDPSVAEWWVATVDRIYGAVPDFGGFVVKADSEGRVGPSAYGRTPADAANTIANALKPHRGILFYRAFVYNHHLDWRDPEADRARAAYDIFRPLDGKFMDNVVIQTKYGPIDFQAREPVSPLFSGLHKTVQAVELQITQEYTGQQRHLCFLVPMWKEVLDFDLRANNTPTPVKEIVSGKSFHRALGGFVGVANVGLDANWLGHPFAMANLYGFARLAWNPDLSASEIAREWIGLTFGSDRKVGDTISAMLLSSWKTYESYTGPLGAQTLTDILGSHYGPGIESSENNGWGQWHRADGKGIGMDRTVSTGTGFAGQYPPEVAKVYENLATTPDDLLLFFHHVPYTYKLHSGKSVIQHIYDSHYAGAEGVAWYVREWQALAGRVDNERYTAILARLEYQVGHAVVWRDAICNYFLRLSGIPDAHDRVSNHPDRVEAESMKLEGYASVEVTPWENASSGKAIACGLPAGCTASFIFKGPPGDYGIAIQYFDQNNGAAKFRLSVAGRVIDQWSADDHLPSAKVGGDTSTRRTVAHVALKTGDEVRLEGIPDGGEQAALDYVEISPAPK